MSRNARSASSSSRTVRMPIATDPSVIQAVLHQPFGAVNAGRSDLERTQHDAVQARRKRWFLDALGNAPAVRGTHQPIAVMAAIEEHDEAADAVRKSHGIEETRATRGAVAVEVHRPIGDE